MRWSQRLAKLAALLVCATITATAFSAAAPSAKPEDVGLSTARLKHVAELVQRHIDAGSFSGAVTLVARNGRIAYYEAAGSMDLEAKKPMAKDAMFRIMSMTKPVIGVATMMMIEEGKVRLQDPISKFIPEWADMTVAIPNAQPAARVGGAPTQARRRPGRRAFVLHRARGARSHHSRLAHAHRRLVSGPMSNAAARKVAAGRRTRSRTTSRGSAKSRSSSSPARAGRTAPRLPSTRCLESSRSHRACRSTSS